MAKLSLNLIKLKRLYRLWKNQLTSFYCRGKFICNPIISLNCTISRCVYKGEPQFDITMSSSTPRNSSVSNDPNKTIELRKQVSNLLN